jgi:ABC-type lipoprotein export system ATPase subunit
MKGGGMASTPTMVKRGGIGIVGRGLRKAFDGGLVQALGGADLVVAPGERVAITGPTGCGKSTLLAILALLERPDGGELLLDGVPASEVASPEAWRSSDVGLVFQLHHLFPHLTVEENVLLPVLTSRRTAMQRARRILTDLGLDGRAGTLAARLSGGERQLAAVARALINRPRLVLADEPTGSVDSATGRRILATVLAACEESGSTLVVVSHDPLIAARLGRTVVMKDGRTVEAQ